MRLRFAGELHVAPGLSFVGADLDLDNGRIAAPRDSFDGVPPLTGMTSRCPGQVIMLFGGISPSATRCFTFCASGCQTA